MQFGLRTALVVIAGAMAGCLTTNPNLPVNDDGGGTQGSSGSDPTGSPSSAGPTTASTDPTTGATSTAGDTMDPDSTETADPTSDSETTGPAACGGGNLCVADAPPGWSGPVVWAETMFVDEEPSCPADYPEPAFTAFNDLQAPPAECECECGAATGNISCGPVSLEYHATDSSCFGSANDDFSISAGGACQSGPNITTTGRYWAVDDPGVTGGSCAPNSISNVPTATWASRSTVCGGVTASSGACDPGQACIPAPADGFESRLCVWQPGELECPAGDFTDRFVRHEEDIDDTRNCATCTCSSPAGECSGSVRLWPTNDCSGGFGSGTVSIGGSCTQSVDAVRAADASTLSVSNVSCQPSVGTAIGEAEPADPYTLCCMSV